MNVFSELRKLYFEIDDEYSTNEFTARSNGHQRKENYWKRKRELNTHAYFLFLFTRLENLITTKSIALVDQKKGGITHWKTKAIWENTDPDKLHFKKRVGLLTEKGQAIYNKISSYYELRNEIGHGGTIPSITSAIDMVTVFDDMKIFFDSLK